MHGRAYYNEIDAKKAAWLRELMYARVIVAGDVDERSVVDVRPADLAGYTQCHFFAGIGIWSYALRLAGWPDDRAVWTGSCPCQPWSVAGKGEGADDPRHLWPAWFELIRVRRPATIFGEQTASEDGRYWLDIVFADLEADDYAVGAIDLPACSVGAPHKRNRLWVVADTHGRGARQQPRELSGDESEHAERGAIGDHAPLVGGAAGRRLGHAGGPGLEGHAGDVDDGDQPGWVGADATRSVAAAGPVNGFWAAADWLACTDGKARAVEPGTFPLADGAAARVLRLRAYGDGIVAPLAAEVIGAYLDLER